MSDITLHRVTKRNGPAGQVEITASVQYEDEDTQSVTFVGSVYGGPVVMITPGNPGGTFVTDPGRFGDFGEPWVRRFFA